MNWSQETKIYSFSGAPYTITIALVSRSILDTLCIAILSAYTQRVKLNIKTIYLNIHSWVNILWNRAPRLLILERARISNSYRLYSEQNKCNIIAAQSAKWISCLCVQRLRGNFKILRFVSCNSWRGSPSSSTF